MPFIGKSPTAGFASIVKDDLTPNGSTTAFTLSKQVANVNDIAVFVGNVRQEPTDAYTVNGTTLTMSEAPASGLNFYVLHIAGTVESSVVPADNTISTGKLQASAVTDAKIAAMSASKLTGAMASGVTGVGKVLQVVQTHLNTVQSVASSNTSNFADFSGFNATITPSSTSSKIMVMADVNYGINVGTIHFRLVRGSTAIAVHDTPGGSRIASTKNSRPEASPYAIYSDNLSMNFLDTPSTTSATTYKVQGTLGATYNDNMYLNRPYHMGDSNDYNGRGVSTLILMEIGQ